MPNYRNKNKNKRSKNRAKNNNVNKNNANQQHHNQHHQTANHQQQQQQQQALSQSQPGEDITKLHDEKRLFEPQPTATADDQQHFGCIPNVPDLTRISNDDRNNSITIATDVIPQSTTTTPSPSEANTNIVTEVDTISQAAGTKIVSALYGHILGNDRAFVADVMNRGQHSEMGASIRKAQSLNPNNSKLSSRNNVTCNDFSELKENHVSQQCGKIIVHRIVREDTDGKSNQEVDSNLQNDNESIARAVKQQLQEQKTSKVNIHDIPEQIAEISSPPRDQDQDIPYCVEYPPSPTSEEDSMNDRDEGDNLLEIKTEANNNDNTLDATDLVEGSQPLISEEDIGVETEGEKRAASHHQNTLKQLRALKRAAIEDHFLPQFLNPRYLDSITEENSDASDARSEASDMERGGMNYRNELKDGQDYNKTNKFNEVHPRIGLDSAKKRRHLSGKSCNRVAVVLQEDTTPSFVEARIFEPTVEESCTSWSSIQTPESEAAEIVYINSASSSTSDLMDLDSEECQTGTTSELTEGVDLNTDISQIFTQTKSSNAQEDKTHHELRAVNEASLLAQSNGVAKDINDEEIATINSMTPTSSEIENRTEKPNDRVALNEESEARNHEALCVDREKSKPAALINDLVDRKPNSSNRREISATDDNASTIATSSILIANPNDSSSGKLPLSSQMNDIREILNGASKELQSQNIAQPSSRRSDVIAPLLTTQNSLKGDANGFSADDVSNLQEQESLWAEENNKSDPAVKKLRLLCTEAVASMPYGEDILEELASVAQNIGEIQASQRNDVQKNNDNMPYPLPDLPVINDIQIQPSKISEQSKPSSSLPPPVPNPPIKYDSWLGIPTETNPQLLVCLSPAQRSLISDEKTLNSRETDDLLDAHKKFIERRGYHEYTTEQVNAINVEKAAEHKIIETAAMMKRLRKSLTPPPPIPPLPAPRQMRSDTNVVKPKSTTEATTAPKSAEKNSDTNASIRCGIINESQSTVTNENVNKHRLLAIIHCHSDEVETIETPAATASMASSTATTATPSIASHAINPPHSTNNQQTTSASETVQNLKQSSSVPSSSTFAPEPAPGIQKINQKLFPDGNFVCDSSMNSQCFESVAAKSSQTQSSFFTLPTTSSSSSTTTTRETTARTTTATTTKEKHPVEKISLKFPEKYSHDNKMNDLQREIFQSFPTRNQYDEIHSAQKRFSNIETSNQWPFYSQTVNSNPKRFSNVETTKSESRKRIENGQVIYDTSDSTHESYTIGERPQKAPSDASHFPVNIQSPEGLKWPLNGKEKSVTINRTSGEANISQSDVNPKVTNTSNINEIMSALNLNTATSSSSSLAAADRARTPPTKTTLVSSNSTTEKQINERHEKSEIVFKNKSASENSTFDGLFDGDSYEKFRQSANITAPPTTTSAAAAAAEKQTTSTPIETTAKNRGRPTSALHFDKEKLFKDFDELSQQLNKELECTRLLRGQREKSASLYDLSRLQTESKTRFDELKRERHEHMKELEREIERSAQTRQFKRPAMGMNTFSTQSSVREEDSKQSKSRTYQIPIRLETSESAKEAPSMNKEKRSYEIPIKVEHEYTVTSPLQSETQQYDNYSSRKAESMYDLSNLHKREHHRRSFPVRDLAGNCHDDDWNRYSTDFGLSENITKPFAREVEICYQRCRPNTIRAPRLSASTDDLSSHSTLFDNRNATHYTKQIHAPTLNPTPQKFKPQYLSCHSMIERDPNPTYISTTSRRGVSPVPPATPTPPLMPEARNITVLRSEGVHEQRLKDIANKEQELKAQFERLESERRRLLEEMRRPSVMSRSNRYIFRSTQKLPTLSEEEVFRQQMAEEWLSKIAEREERRLQKIIKLSKINDQEAGRGVPVSLPSCPKTDIGDEFLKKVKERRSKLAMPADSDWESGAESQPNVRQHEHASDAEEPPPVKIIEGKTETDLRQLPKHLLEFAKFSNHESEHLNNGHREIHQEEERRKEGNEKSMSTATKRTSIIKTYKVSRRPESQQFGSAGDANKYTEESPGMHGVTKHEGRSSYQQTRNGCISEPEQSYDSDYSTVKYRTLDRKRLQSLSLSSADTRITGRSSRNDTNYGTMPNPVKAGQNLYKNQPGRIEDYMTGHSSVSEKEKKEWWDEVMDIFNGLEQSKLSPSYTEGNLSRALAKESGYTSDSNLVFRRREIPQRNPLSPVEQKQAYKSVQAGGQPPLFGFQKPAPEKPKESPNRYIESDVNIHYKTPIRYEYKEPIAEEELAMRQAEQMQKLYQEERRRKYLQELQDMNSRRHADNFTPSQKSPIPLNRYEDFQADLAPKISSPAMSPRTVARALYSFQGQTARELTFRKGDVIYIRRKIDKNWYEGEHNAMIGLLPASYVEIISKDGIRQPLRKAAEGQARAKYNFQAQSGIELSLNKGELVTLTRRVDDNWFEGKIANRKGIFPVSYVEVLSDIGSKDYSTPRTVANQRPSLEALRASINDELNAITQNGHHTPNGILRETRNTPTTDMLHVDTSSNPLTFRALYKYRPQNSDELELQEGDIIHVLEKCDDGWFVGTSQRTGYFGTFPGNYVERV